jgi:hypothetical protein
MASVNHLVIGQSGFQIYCDSKTLKTRVVFGMYDREQKSLAWYLFSSTVAAKSQRECATTDVFVTDEPFGGFSGASFPRFLRNAISVHQLVSDAKSPISTIRLDTGQDPKRIYCRLNDLDTKSNGKVDLTFTLRKMHEPERGTANLDLRGKLFFLEVGAFNSNLLSIGPQGKTALSGIPTGFVGDGSRDTTAGD